MTDEVATARTQFLDHCARMIRMRGAAGQQGPHFATIEKLGDFLERCQAMEPDERSRWLLENEQELVETADLVDTGRAPSVSASTLHREIWGAHRNATPWWVTRRNLESLRSRLFDIALQDARSDDDRAQPARPPQGLVRFVDDALNDRSDTGTFDCKHLSTRSGEIETQTCKRPTGNDPQFHCFEFSDGVDYVVAFNRTPR